MFLFLILIGAVFYLLIIKSSKDFGDNDSPLEKRKRVEGNTSPYVGDYYNYLNDEEIKDKLKEMSEELIIYEFTIIAKKLFKDINIAFYNEKIDNFRDYLSDRTYFRYKLKYDLNKRLGIKNILEKLNIEKARISDVKKDGNYIVIDIVFDFLIRKRENSDLILDLDKYDCSYYGEKWSFIKAVGVDKEEIYFEKCLNCGNTIDISVSDSVKCPNCNTMIINNKHNWIVSEITILKGMVNQLVKNDVDEENRKHELVKQFVNNAINNKAVYNRDQLNKDEQLLEEVKRYKFDYETMDYVDEFKIYEMLDKELLKEISYFDKSFSLQSIEDKASHAMVEILMGISDSSRVGINRFLTEQLYKKLEKKIIDRYIYSLNINQAAVIKIKKDKELYKLSVFINYELTIYNLKKNSNEIGSENDYQTAIYSFVNGINKSGKVEMELIRSVDAQTNMGNLYAHNCSSCGGNIDEITDIHCNYCGNELNNPDYEWIVNDLKFIGSDFL